jgi:hypothetical protein
MRRRRRRRRRRRSYERVSAPSYDDSKVQTA